MTMGGGGWRGRNACVRASLAASTEVCISDGGGSRKSEQLRYRYVYRTNPALVFLSKGTREKIGDHPTKVLVEVVCSTFLIGTRGGSGIACGMKRSEWTWCRRGRRQRGWRWDGRTCFQRWNLGKARKMSGNTLWNRNRDINAFRA